ncbi:MAG TPA: efflux RND transporter periplasmic adaptor subunit [Kofleriaceae bacterium]|nr:efflux RND transporter periplasmic adaptor subunit [Kofleriaceae bacterium]
MTPRARATVIRIVVALAVIGGIAWWLQGRDDGTSKAAAGPQGARRDAAGGEGSGGRGGGASPSGGAGGAGDRIVPVQTATAEKKDVPIWLEGLGTVAAFQQVTVRPQVDGRLDKVLFVEGQPVKQGDVLAQIDPRPFQVQLHQAQGALARDQAQLETARRNLDRYQGLRAQQLVAQQQVDEIAGQLGALEGSVKIDRAQVESAQLQLDYAQVKAPLDGITGVRLVDAGNLIKANDPTGIVVITAIHPAAVLFTVPQDRLGPVAAAMARGDVTVEVWNRDSTKQLATGKLAVLDNQVNQTTATLRLKALVPNPSRALWPNAFVKARMLVETRAGALVVPSVAIQRGPAGTYVYIVGPDKTAVMKPVTVGLLAGEQAIIEKGLGGGERVVIEGQNQLRPGGRVEQVVAKPAVAAGSAARNGSAGPVP